MKNVGTLKELNVKKGDVVELVELSLHMPGYEKYIGTQSIANENGGTEKDQNGEQGWFKQCKHIFKIVSRAELNSVKCWRDLSDEEKGKLLLARHNKDDIEISLSSKPGKVWSLCINVKFIDENFYRVKPKPVIEQEIVKIFYAKGFGGEAIGDDSWKPTHKFTFDTVDGVPDCSTVKMEKI